MGVLDPWAEMLPRLASAVHRRALWAGRTPRRRHEVVQTNVSSHPGRSDLSRWTRGLGEPASASEGEGGAAGVSLQSGAWRC